MKKIVNIIAAAALMFGLVSCNVKIENPTARNFVGTWDLQSTEIVALDGSVTTTTPKTLDYIVITNDDISFYYSDKLDDTYKFAVKDNVVYLDGKASYNVDSFATKEMTLSHDGLLLVSSYRYHYKKR